MPALTDITINDGQATPVAHTFSPQGIDSNGVAVLYDRLSGVPAGFGQLTLSSKFPKPGSSNASSVVRQTFVIRIPTLDVDNNVAYTCQAKVEFILPQSSSLIERKDIAAFVSNLLTQAPILEMIHDVEAAY